MKKLDITEQLIFRNHAIKNSRKPFVRLSVPQIYMVNYIQLAVFSVLFWGHMPVFLVFMA